MDEITPVFICGMGRSGTTNALRILNMHPLVMLNGEIPLSILKHFFALLDGTENSYSDEDRRRVWHENKAQYLFESFGYLSKGGRGRLDKAREAKFRGHKAPRLEMLFQRYETHFSEIGPQPRYFYCARNPFDCWRSHRAMTWGSETVQEFLRQYIASFENLRQMQERAAGRVTVLNLDDLKNTPDFLAYYSDKIFKPLGLDVPEKTATRIVRSSDKRESTPTTPLERDDEKTIADYPGIAALLETHFPGAKEVRR